MYHMATSIPLLSTSANGKRGITSAVLLPADPDDFSFPFLTSGPERGPELAGMFSCDRALLEARCA